MKSILKLFAFLAIVITITSCSLFQKAQAPPKSIYADTLSYGIATRIHDGYSAMLGSDSKDFITWQSFYEENLNDIYILALYDSTRKHNSAILRLTNDWYKRLTKYEMEHQALNSLNNGQIIIYQDGMDIAGKKVYLTESKYK